MASRDATIFLCGDVMTGRAVDQILPTPSVPRLYEPYVKSAVEYVEMAERRYGPIPKPASSDYIWGDALGEFRRVAPDARIINLETSVTTSEDYERKGINYRMHPANVPCITAAGIDCCVLANNHVLDWGGEGLLETLAVLEKARLKTSGAGRNLRDAIRPAVLQARFGSRILVFSAGAEDSGIPNSWAATNDRPGVVLLPDFSLDTADLMARQVERFRRPGDLTVISIHWGGNWGYSVPAGHRAFARRLIESEAADVVHGHSSHHPKPVEVYRNKLILYGCGDFLNDYEGISGYEQFRSDLVLMYFATVDRSNASLQRLEMVPLKTRRFRLHHTSRAEAEWVRDVLTREGERFGTRALLRDANRLELQWK